MEYYGTTATEKDLGWKLQRVHISSNHKTDPPKSDDEVYITSSTSISTSSPIVLPTGCPVGKMIVVKCVGANGYVQSSEGITGFTSTSKSTDTVSVSKSARRFIYTGTTYGWLATY